MFKVSIASAVLLAIAAMVSLTEGKRGCKQDNDAAPPAEGAVAASEIDTACSWPPLLETWRAAGDTETPMANIELELRDGDWWIVEEPLSDKAISGFYLVTGLTYGRGGQFLGVHQRFIRGVAFGAGAYRLGILPEGTEYVVASIRACAVDITKWPEERFQHWHAMSFGRFSTWLPAAQRGFRFEDGPIDRDLGKWLRDCGADVSEEMHIWKVFEMPDCGGHDTEQQE